MRRWLPTAGLALTLALTFAMTAGMACLGGVPATAAESAENAETAETAASVGPPDIAASTSNTSNTRIRPGQDGDVQCTAAATKLSVGSILGIAPSMRTLGILAVGGVAAMVSYQYENPDRMAQALDASYVDGIADIGNVYGSGWVVGGAAVTTLAAGQVIGSNHLRDFGADLFRSYLYTGGLVLALKHSIDRRRPTGGHLSFPSGHTAAAFSTVPVVGHHFGWPAGVAVAAVAVGTGLSRLGDSHHYLSDVFFGAAIGLAVGDAVANSRRASQVLKHLVVSSNAVAYVTRF